ncbi:hypothetical protein JW890_05980 [candidate division WOR-3 bacterium]|nr:hypothetical protein [candidate division WOR-3 bacterium]
MNDLTRIKNRFLKDPINVRLGGLASNLSRIKSFISQDDNYEAVKSILEESKFFIEWTAQEINSESAAVLIQYQIQLALWQQNLKKLWSIQDERRKIASEAYFMSQKILKMSGLLG